MRSLILVLVLLFSGAVSAEVPTVALPLELRQSNWVGEDGSGSCTHATTIMLLRWQLQAERASEWQAKYSGGDWADSTWNYRENHAAKFDREEIQFSYVTNGDPQFLDWALATRRGAGITVMGGRHAVLLVHLDDEKAILCDNNDVDNLIVVPRDRLLNEWRNSNGWSWTVVGSPAPPLPKRD